MEDVDSTSESHRPSTLHSPAPMPGPDTPCCPCSYRRDVAWARETAPSALDQRVTIRCVFPCPGSNLPVSNVHLWSVILPSGQDWVRLSCPTQKFSHHLKTTIKISHLSLFYPTHPLSLDGFTAWPPS